MTHNSWLSSPKANENKLYHWPCEEEEGYESAVALPIEMVNKLNLCSWPLLLSFRDG